MSDKIVKKIMFYDEAQKAWVVDMMEMENNDQELMFICVIELLTTKRVMLL
jgi:hypothetical protein